MARFPKLAMVKKSVGPTLAALRLLASSETPASRLLASFETPAWKTTKWNSISECTQLSRMGPKSAKWKSEH
jgi:hypothetical protein